VIQAFAGRGSVEVTSEVLAGLEHDDPRVRSATLKLLAMQTPGEWTPRLYDVFRNDPDVQVRHDCAKALGQLNPPGAADVLLEFFDDPLQTPIIVFGAIEALARISDPRAEDVLGELAGSDDPEICEAAASALEQMMEHAEASV